MGCANQSTRHNLWTKITRPKYERAAQRYASDLTDAEWAVIEPHMPATKHLGRPRETDLRAVLDGILYIARTGADHRFFRRRSTRHPRPSVAAAVHAGGGRERLGGVSCISAGGGNCAAPKRAPTLDGAPWP